MSGPVGMIFAAILTLSVTPLAAEPSRISDLDKFCEEIVQKISNKARREAADLITNSMGKPEASGTVANALQVFEGNNFDFTKKVIDKRLQRCAASNRLLFVCRNSRICLFSIQFQNDERRLDFGELRIQG